MGNDVDFASYLKGDFEPLPDSEFKRKWWAFEGARHTYELAETKLTLGEHTYRIFRLVFVAFNGSVAA